MDKKILYKKAYRMLEDTTPLKYDCSLLCDGKCCSGDTNAGMHLYPGEESLIGPKYDFLNIRNEDLKGTEISFATCSGQCDRSFRPLACRIYPLAPHIDGQGRLSIIEDPRARYICPLLMDLDEVRIGRLFTRKVLQVFRLLAQDEEIRDYIASLSIVLDEYSKFTGG